MGIIKIDKRAASEAEERLLLEQIYAQPDSFGVPTKIIKVDEYRASTESLKDFRKALKRDIGDFVKANIPNPVYAFYKARKEANIVSGDIIGYELTNEGRLYCKAHNVYQGHYRDCASFYSPEEYREPHMGMVIISKSDVSGKELMAHSLGVAPDLQDILSPPGNDVQWQINRLLHEKAHIIGAGEPQADMMAAVAMRKMVEDKRVIRARADARSYAGVICYWDVGMQSEYGGCVEANDYVMSLPIEVIDNITYEQLKNMRFQSFESYDFSTERVGQKIESKVGKGLFQSYFPDTLSKAARDLCASGEITDKKERQIAMRFALAAKRFFVGEEAYGENAHKLIDEELLASERAKPLTFEPDGEFIPVAE